MKSLKQMIHIFILSSTLILPSFSFAGSWTFKNHISSIGIRDGRILVHGDFKSDNIDACTETLVVVLLPQKSDYPEIYALVVASYLQNNPVSFYVSGCIALYGTTYPIISLVNSYHTL